MRVVLLALGLLLATASPAAACSPAAAKAAIAQTKPRLALVADKQLVTPGQADAVLCFDLTADGRTDMAVSLFSGGTAGDVGWLVFVPDGARWRLAGSGGGYKLRLHRRGSRLEVVQPVYRKNDPNCCPTGGFDRTLYRWNGSRLVVARTSHTKRSG
ncbi:MAG TPA: hypothetical protein VGF23_18935 [Gaiellaceae bacterium]